MVCEITFPDSTAINGKEIDCHFRDSFKVCVNRSGLDAKVVYHAIFGFLPPSARWALSLRNALVGFLGFSASNTEMSLPLESIKTGEKAGFLIIESVCDTEIICGAYEKNMDMWLSVLKLSNQEFAVSTLVNLKTNHAKVYMFIIKPFHKLVAKYCIRQALKSGRI